MRHLTRGLETMGPYIFQASLIFVYVMIPAGSVGLFNYSSSLKKLPVSFLGAVLFILSI